MGKHSTFIINDFIFNFVIFITPEMYCCCEIQTPLIEQTKFHI